MLNLKPAITAINGHTLIRRAKNARNHVVDLAFRALGHQGRDAFVESFSPQKETLVFAIAFNTPWVIDVLAVSWKAFVRDADLVVVDNSSDMAARAQHREICEARGIPYISLPRNYEWNPSRSHAIAMNWVFYNLVKAFSPRYFGFIDHDCFPRENVVFGDLIDRKAVYGLKRQSSKSSDQWYLWAGFCFFQHDRYSHLPLDYKHSYENGMDTGGNNWSPIYSCLKPLEVTDAGSQLIVTDLDGLRFEEEIVGEKFSHMRGASYRAAFAEGRRDVYRNYILRKYLSEHTAQADDLVAARQDG